MHRRRIDELAQEVGVGLHRIGRVDVAEVAEVVRHLLHQHLEAGLRIQPARPRRAHQRRGLVAQQDVEQRRVRFHARHVQRQRVVFGQAQRRGVDDKVVALGRVAVDRDHGRIEEGVELGGHARGLAGGGVEEGDVLGAVHRAALGQRHADGRGAHARAEDQHALAAERHVAAVERADQAFAVEQVALELVALGAAHHVDRARHAAEQAAAVEQVDHARLVRRRDHHAAHVARQEGRLHEHREVAHRHLHGHQHRVDAVAREGRVEHARQPHVADRVAGDEVGLGAASDEWAHGRASVRQSLVSGRNSGLYSPFARSLLAHGAPNVR
ncbi:hypothetical protein D9M72_398660 [compost metagenome]